MPELNEYLSRVRAAEELTRAGYRVSVSTLQRLSRLGVGGGPPYTYRPQRGRPVVYRWADLIAWAKDKFPDETIWRTRRGIAELLSENGYQICFNTLQAMAWTSAGPPYELRGRRSYYRVDLALRWAEKRWKEKLAKKNRPAD